MQYTFFESVSPNIYPPVIFHTFLF